MSSAADPGEKRRPELAEAEPTSGINLVVIYSLLAGAILAAVIFAWAIVRPFYLRR